MKRHMWLLDTTNRGVRLCLANLQINLKTLKVDSWPGPVKNVKQENKRVYCWWKARSIASRLSDKQSDFFHYFPCAF